MIYTNIYETIGNTPIVKLKTPDNMANIYAKLEFFNPGGSVKDRIASNMIFALLNDGIITQNSTIIEPTSGNTGIGIAMICSSLGLKCILTMPESMSIERRKILKAYGATLVLTDASKGMAGAIEKAIELSALENHVLLSQFQNPYNPKAHANSTALEIIKDFPQGLSTFVSGIGTGGTITGVSSILKHHFNDMKIIGVEPENSPFLTKGVKGPHKIQGIGAGFKPEVLDLTNITDIFTVSDDDAITFAKKCALENGILLGFSGGAAFKIAFEIAKTLDNTQNILFIAPDNGERYISTTLFED